MGAMKKEVKKGGATGKDDKVPAAGKKPEEKKPAAGAVPAEVTEAAIRAAAKDLSKNVPMEPPLDPTADLASLKADLAELAGSPDLDGVKDSLSESTKKTLAALKPAKPAAKKGGGGGKAKTPRGEGVIATIAEILKKAPKAGVTKAEIVAELSKRFPDRAPDSMTRTVNVQVPGRISREKGINVVNRGEGRYGMA
jgi:hypothetical protein